jgi:hypothetical protein
MGQQFGPLEQPVEGRVFMNMPLQKMMVPVKERAFVAAVMTLCALTHGVAPVYACGGLADAQMPAAVTTEGKVLALNGTGVGTKIRVHVYLIGLYLEKKTTDPGTAITSDETKRIALIMLRNVSRQQFVSAVEKGMVRNSNVPMPTLRSRLDRLEQALPALKKGNLLDFTYVPGAGTVVRGQGRELKIPGRDFAEALFSVWLGPHADGSSLRHDLLGGD